jgi:hypothetical protein
MWNTPKSRECRGGTLIEEGSVEDCMCFDTDMLFGTLIVQFNSRICNILVGYLHSKLVISFPIILSSMRSGVNT